MVVADGDIEVSITVSITTHGAATGELVLVGSGEVARASELIAAIEEAQQTSPYEGVRFRLVADRRTEALDPLPEVVADALGLRHRRELLQMRRLLPVEADHPERHRAPPPGMRPVDLHGLHDVAAWLRVNNRAFVDHPDQGAETAETFMRRVTVEHDDPSGFLVADDPIRPGELAGFCWTKVHPATDTDPRLGEIYVIGVDPSCHGQGLGTAYVLAGLDQLAASGIGTAMLYVESDNGPARRLYDRLGFTTHLWRRVYSAHLS